MTSSKRILSEFERDQIAHIKAKIRRYQAVLDDNRKALENLKRKQQNLDLRKRELIEEHERKLRAQLEQIKTDREKIDQVIPAYEGYLHNIEGSITAMKHLVVEIEKGISNGRQHPEETR